mgnify:CR=1 FL=1
MASTTAYLLMHEGIRTELHRLAGFAEKLAAGCRPAEPRQFTALRAHVGEVMVAIHHHHVGEDEHLWPLLRSKTEPGAFDDGLAALSRDHDRLDGLMDEILACLDQLAAAGTTSWQTGTADRLAAVTRTLRDLMDTHLTVEEALVVPAFTGLLTDDEAHRMEKRMQAGSEMKISFVLPWLAEADPVRMAELIAGGGLLFRVLLAATRGRYLRRLATAYAPLRAASDTAPAYAAS